MAWVRVPGLAGRVYVPDDTGQMQKKHSCRTCFSCQWCDESRCRVCRGEAPANGKAPSSCCRVLPCVPKKGNLP